MLNRRERTMNDSHSLRRSDRLLTRSVSPTLQRIPAVAGLYARSRRDLSFTSAAPSSMRA